MRNRKLYHNLERILETSLSPQRKRLMTGRLLYNPSVALASIQQIPTARTKCLDSLEEDE